MAVVDSSGVSQKSYTYDVYGEATPTGALANEFDFAGQQTDGTGLQYLRARYYDSETGTFFSRDPMSASASWLDSPHGYTPSPCNEVDPSGLAASPGHSGGSDCETIYKKIMDRVKDMVDKAREWFDGDYGQWDFKNQRPTDETFRTNHRAQYENEKTGYKNWKALNDGRDDCKNGPKPPGFHTSVLLGEYLVGKNLDEAAHGLFNESPLHNLATQLGLLQPLTVFAFSLPGAPQDPGLTWGGSYCVPRGGGFPIPCP